MSRRIMVLGAPGAGKTTLAVRLAHALGMDTLSSGDVAREIAEEDYAVRAALSAGDFVPPDIMDSRILAEIRERKSVVVDGYPRYGRQLEDALSLYPCPFFVFLHLNPAKSMKRLRQRMRADFNEEAEFTRLKKYTEQTYPLILDLMLVAPSDTIIVDPIHPPEGVFMAVLKRYQDRERSE